MTWAKILEGFLSLFNAWFRHEEREADRQAGRDENALNTVKQIQADDLAVVAAQSDPDTLERLRRERNRSDP